MGGLAMIKSQKTVRLAEWAEASALPRELVQKVESLLTEEERQALYEAIGEHYANQDVAFRMEHAEIEAKRREMRNESQELQAERKKLASVRNEILRNRDAIDTLSRQYDHLRTLTTRMSLDAQARRSSTIAAQRVQELNRRIEHLEAELAALRGEEIDGEMVQSNPTFEDLQAILLRLSPELFVVMEQHIKEKEDAAFAVGKAAGGVAWLDGMLVAGRKEVEKSVAQIGTGPIAAEAASALSLLRESAQETVRSAGEMIRAATSAALKLSNEELIACLNAHIHVPRRPPSYERIVAGAIDLGIIESVADLESAAANAEEEEGGDGDGGDAADGTRSGAY
jgi:DNA repair exonuclease SbcCD ATPase subunit